MTRWTGWVAVLALTMLGGCAEAQADAPQRAVATCSLPVEQELDLASNQQWKKSQIEVTDLAGGGLQVNAVATIYTDGSREQVERGYTCELAPDSSDERGFRVVSLVVHQPEGHGLRPLTGS